jgi:pimeloyl-ACP methyl ester carboxylesterase
MLPSEGHVTTEDGARLYYQIVGSGPETLVIPNAAYTFVDFQRLAAGRTAIFYDLRNRGRSDRIDDGSKLSRGILHDVDDLEAVRRHFALDHTAVLGHSYVAMTVALYAMRHPERVSRVVQLGAPPPDHGKQYPAHLTGADETLASVVTRLAKLQEESRSAGTDPDDFPKKWWSLLRLLYVVDPADADKITWSLGDQSAERFASSMKQWSENLLPSMHSLALTADDFAGMQAPVLLVHGTRDRQCPYGGARDWAMQWPEARLVTVENAAHLPWIESPDLVYGAAATFLDGAWPEAAQKVSSLEPV